MADRDAPDVGLLIDGARISAASCALRIGDSLDDATEIGSLTSPEQGAKLCIGGAIKRGGMYDAGSFDDPAVFADVTPDRVIAQEEIFDPVVSIMPFDSEERAITLANGSIYGLSGSLWTRDIGRALRVVRAVETGVISINTGWSVHMEMPFGVKRSGMGASLAHPRWSTTASRKAHSSVTSDE